MGVAALLERDELLARLDEARSGGGRLVFVGGEAGVGKTSPRGPRPSTRDPAALTAVRSSAQARAASDEERYRVVGHSSTPEGAVARRDGHRQASRLRRVGVTVAQASPFDDRRTLRRSADRRARARSRGSLAGDRLHGDEASSPGADQDRQSSAQRGAVPADGSAVADTVLVRPDPELVAA